MKYVPFIIKLIVSIFIIIGSLCLFLVCLAFVARGGLDGTGESWYFLPVTPVPLVIGLWILFRYWLPSKHAIENREMEIHSNTVSVVIRKIILNIFRIVGVGILLFAIIRLVLYR